MTVERDDAASDQATLEDLRADVDRQRAAAGRQLAACREAVALSQRELGERVGMTRNCISKIENGHRGGDAESWRNMDEVCDAAGGLRAAYDDVAAAQQRYRTRRCAAERAARLQAGLDALQAACSPLRVVPIGPVTTGPTSDAMMTEEDLAQELHRVLMRLARLVDRRTAIRIIGMTMAAVGLPGNLDPDELERVARAVCVPRQADARVIDHLAAMLAYAKRLEDSLGPAEVLPTVVAQYEIVRGLRKRCPDELHPRLSALHSSQASSIGTYLLDLGDPQGATAYFRDARSTAHHAGSQSCACYAMCNLSYVAFVGGEAYTALDTSAAARSLAARDGDPLLRALSEQMASSAYALDGQESACLAASDRAHEWLSSTANRRRDSLAYFLHPGNLGSVRLKCLLLLGRPAEAVAAASRALVGFDQRYIGDFARAKSRYADALVASKEIDEAARILADAATLAIKCPSTRLTEDLRIVRASMQPWQGSQAVRTLDAQLAACGLLPGRPMRA